MPITLDRTRFAWVTIKVYTFITLANVSYVHLLTISFSKISYMFLILVKIYSMSINFPKIIMFSLNFIIPFSFFFCIKDLFSGATILSGKSKDDLYPLHSLHQIKPQALIGECVSLTQWHAKLGHSSLRTVHQILSKHQLAVSNNKTWPPFVMHVNFKKVIVCLFIYPILGLSFL
jgi:hypothetical protein